MPKRSSQNDGPLVVIVSGASATMLMPAYLVQLRQMLECRLRVIMTKSAERFVRPEVLGWFAHEVLTADAAQVNPVEVALTAQGIVVLPASANTVGSAALGLADSLAQTVLLASPSPCLFFPHMNPVMWDKRIVQQHVATLRADGHVVVDPEERQAFEIWRGSTQPARAMPQADKVSAMVADWLAQRQAAEDVGAA